MTATAIPARYLNGEPISEDQDPIQRPVVDENILDEEKSRAESQLDDLELQVAQREWTVKGPYTVRLRNGGEEERQFERTYVQKPLSFTGMLQFTGLIGEKISEVMSGPDGLTINGIMAESLGLLASGGLLTQADFSGADSLIRGLAKLASLVPDLIEECQCIWLRVPFHERPIVKHIWSLAPEDGGLTVAEGQEMLEIFIEQNYDEVHDFFAERLQQLTTRLTQLRAKKESSSGVSPLSKLSRLTRAATRSQ